MADSPAFPGTEKNSDGSHFYSHLGMSLRDWFAGQAIAGGLARDTLREYELEALFGKHRTGITRAEILAADAYRIAEAMLTCSKTAGNP